ncbi:ribosomal protein S18-alanine N-acetyltransferase [Corynebacterium epidermidicanis]|uniref:[Ribosomal protein bS18]-alanine N-acetyltransferase n=1 Tax=Corynebacterium epidermidicanis TaxID=1050174 RepID=A0A0G3GU21_9CORY|nr:ribosomal protein S18-alanine N-acetyltransferase [Corynebacterium epidermidicanis]AKK02362.1 ribosomal-protein-alanine acetyltransferase [Corynebacterium epidermidicanis]
MNWEVRRLVINDAARCAELEQQLFAGDDPWPAAAFEQEFAQPNNFYLGVEIDGNLVGYAGLSLLGSLKEPEFEIHTIGVDPAHQRKGIAGELMDQLMHAADQYQGPVFLEVRTDNEPAIAMYEKYGFERMGLRKNYYQPSGADAYTMKREPKK